MKNFKILVVLLALMVITFNSCKKESGVTVTSDALIRYTGSIGGDGCGFLMDIQLNGTTYSPKNLSAEYSKQDRLNVRVTYKLLPTTLECGAVASGGFREIEILSISKL